MSEPRTLYVVVTGSFGGDLAGSLVTEDEVLWGHVSSSEQWLRRDLTTGFSHRAADLSARFPDGYTVEMVRHDDPLPVQIAHHFRPSPAPTPAPETDLG